jgi:hypothetical protein
VYKLSEVGGVWGETILFNFAQTGDNIGYDPETTLTLDASGNLYGCTSEGGPEGGGSVFELAGAPTTATPVFSPVAGQLPHPEVVTITDATAGATIYYTINGATPTTSSTKYVDGIIVSGPITFKAIAVATGLANSAVATATYSIAPTPTITPTFSVPGGTYTSAQTVTLSDLDTGAVFYYTINGTAPTTSSTKYTGPITVSQSETLEVIALASGHTVSAVATAAYTIKAAGVAAPVFTPAAGTYTAAQKVTITDATTGAVIYYTTNGTTPSASSTKYTAAISVGATETIKAIAIAGGKSSAVTTALYAIVLPAATPVITPKGGTYSSAELVTITDATKGATIYYTTNGVAPTTSSTKYTAPVLVKVGETLEAIATATGFSKSAVASAAYKIIGSPSALAGEASAITAAGATLTGQVDTLGLAGSYEFQYGTSSTALTSSTTKTTLSAVTTPLAVSAKLTGLKSKTTYYYQVQVTTAGGVSTGAVLSFTTD